MLENIPREPRLSVLTDYSLKNSGLITLLTVQRPNPTDETDLDVMEKMGLGHSTEALLVNETGFISLSGYNGMTWRSSSLFAMDILIAFHYPPLPFKKKEQRIGN